MYNATGQRAGKADRLGKVRRPAKSKLNQDETERSFPAKATVNKKRVQE